VFTFPYVLHLFAHEFARLSGWRETLALVFACPLDWSFFRHTKDCFDPNRTFGCNEVCARDRRLGLLQLHNDTSCRLDI
jgi:hypothetical protein